MAKLSEDSTKHTLELQKEETKIWTEESKHGNAAVIKSLEEFAKKGPAEVFIEKKKHVEHLHDDLGDEVTNDKLEKLKKTA